MKVRFKCRQYRLTPEKIRDIKAGKLNIGKMILIDPMDHVDFVKTFFKKKHDFDKKQDEESYLDCLFEKWFKKRTYKQHKLQFAICNRIAENPEVGSTPARIHAGIKELYYPKDIDTVTGAMVSLDGEELTTVQYAKVVEGCILEAAETKTDIRDIWILFTEWRYGQKTDPLEGTYANLKQYVEMHPCCEACGDYLLFDDEQGERKNGGHLAHIVSRGSGGVDDDWNRFMFCHRCHLKIQHQKGWGKLTEIYPHLKYKITRAQKKHEKR